MGDPNHYLTVPEIPNGKILLCLVLMTSLFTFCFLTAINKLILAPLLMLNLGGCHCNTVHGWQQAQALGMKLTTVQVMILQQIDLQEEALSE